MEGTTTFMGLLDVFHPVFTQPSFATFRLLMTGWILSHRHRYVTDLIISSDSVGNGHFSDYHRFFSHARWSIDQLWRLLAGLLIKRMIGSDAAILLVGDDTLCRKRGLGLFGAGMHHDPLISSRAKKLVSFGHDWVTLALVVANPWWAPTKVFALPICMRLYRNRQGLTKGKKKKSTKPPAINPNHRTRPELMRDMLKMVSGWFPERRFVFVGDSLYTGESVLRYLPDNMHMIGQVHPKGAMYAPAPEKKPGRGASPKKGARLSTKDEWADDNSAWTTQTFDQYGLHATLDTKTRRGLYYKAGKDRLLTFVLTKDLIGERPTQIFYCTDLTLDVRSILSTYSRRWAIEVTHHDAKQYLGLEDPANRLPLAVKRTAPMAMFLYSLTVLWYAEHGHAHVQFPNRPWYPRKREPSFADMLTTLRRLTWEENLTREPPDSTLQNKNITLLTYLATLAG
jgi:hypothetical protein